MSDKCKCEYEEPIYYSATYRRPLILGCDYDIEIYIGEESERYIKYCPCCGKEIEIELVEE